MTDRQQLRQSKRQARRDLTPAQQQQAGRRLARRAIRHPILRQSKHIALYLPKDGEIDLRPLMQQLWRLGKTCYLPVLSKIRPGHLVFRPYRPQSLMRYNRFGIAEPRAGMTRPGRAMDVVLMPLVAFDRRGNRLGMGGGFYDRTFASPAHRPTLIGTAHHFQAHDALPSEPWDVPLNHILTDQTMMRCR